VAAPYVPQLLALYNPRGHADAIRVHVDHLRKRDAMWWGRFHSDAHQQVYDAAAARERCTHVVQLADARRERKEATVLFVTNHHDLDAFKVRRAALTKAASNSAGGQ
jgi:hypothetical protein